MMIELFKTSIIVQSLVTLLLLTTICILWLAPIIHPECTETLQVPEALYVIVGTVLGYWFKTKDRFNAEQAQRDLMIAVAEAKIVRQHHPPS